MNKYFFLILVGVVLVGTACKNETKKAVSSPKDELIEISVYNMDEIEETYMRFPSADEVLPNLMGNNYAYNSDLLTKKGSHNWIEQQTTKRIILGYYMADLAYLNFFQRPAEYLSYLLAFQELSNELKVRVSLNKETIEKLENQDFNVDSIRKVSTSNYLKLIETYEQDQDTESLFDVSTGLLVEMLYLGFNSLSPDDVNDKVSAILGESKTIMDFYWKYAVNLKITEENSIAQQLENLQILMDKFEVIEQETSNTEVNGKLVLDEEVKYVVDRDQLIELTREVSSIRNSIFKEN